MNKMARVGKAVSFDQVHFTVLSIEFDKKFKVIGNGAPELRIIPEKGREFMMKRTENGWIGKTEKGYTIKAFGHIGHPVNALYFYK